MTFRFIYLLFLAHTTATGVNAHTNKKSKSFYSSNTLISNLLQQNKKKRQRQALPILTLV